MTYNKLIKELEKKVYKENKEVNAVKWMFLNSKYFCGYANLNKEVPEDVKEEFSKLVDKYIYDNIPPQYIVNKVFFFNYDFYVDNGCFIPRPETEQLVEETIYRIDEKYENQHIDIADVCSGSGCIGITLRKEIENSSVTLCELSKEATEIEKRNAQNIGADVIIYNGDFINPLLERNLQFDVILCNPPYIKNDEKLDSLVVDNEPKMALFGGVDGLDFYRIIFDKFDVLLKEKGFMGFEFGYDQKEILEALVKEKLPKYKYEFLKDYNNLYRMLFIYKE